MTISTLKDLDKLIKLCRQRGIQSIKVDNVELHLGEVPVKYKVSTKATNKHTGSLASDFFGDITPDTKIETPDELTDEQLLFYSAQGHEQVEA